MRCTAAADAAVEGTAGARATAGDGQEISAAARHGAATGHAATAAAARPPAAPTSKETEDLRQLSSRESLPSM